MKNIFEHCRNNILHGIPGGQLVTLKEVDFDLGGWQHKCYGGPLSILNNLRQIACSYTIHLLIVDECTSEEQLLQFLRDNTYETKPQWEYRFVWLLAVPTTAVTKKVEEQISKSELNMDRFTEIEKFDGYTIFLNDFMKNIRNI